MKLTEKERRIIASIQLQADASLTKIAKETGYREHSVRYTLSRLLDKEYIRPSAVINLTKLGYTEYEILFSLTCERQEIISKFLDFLIDSSRVTWLAPIAGDFQYVMILCAKDVKELSDFFDALFDRFGHIISAKSFVARISVSLFRRKYLYPQKQKIECVTVPKANEIVTIDFLDHEILSSLAKKPEISFRELARKVACPHSTLVDRIQRLKKTGVIVAFCYSVSFLKYGVYMYRLLLNVRGVNSELRERIFKFCRQDQNITSFTHVIGEWDFAVGAEVNRPDEIIGIVRRLYEICGKDLDSVRVLSRFQNLKWRMYPFDTADD